VSKPDRPALDGMACFGGGAFAGGGGTPTGGGGTDMLIIVKLNVGMS